MIYIGFLVDTSSRFTVLRQQYAEPLNVAAMGKKRKLLALWLLLLPSLETSGLHRVSDESRRKVFNAAAKALGHEDKQVDAPHWKLLVNEHCPDVFYPVVMTGVEKSAP